MSIIPQALAGHFVLPKVVLARESIFCPVVRVERETLLAFAEQLPVVLCYDNLGNGLSVPFSHLRLQLIFYHYVLLNSYSVAS